MGFNITRYLDWVIGGVVGSFAFVCCKDAILPLLSDLIYQRSPLLKGRWRSHIQTRLPDGQEKKSSEIVVVRQLGAKIWGWTEIGPDPMIDGLGLGNSFRGYIRGTCCIVNFESRDKKIPYYGTLFVNILDSATIEGFSIAKFVDKGPIISEYKLKKIP